MGTQVASTRSVGSRLVAVPACRICGTSDNEVLISTPFLSEPVWGFLEPYYKGRIERSLFDGEMFEARLCRACGLIWQSRIPDGPLMGDLYSRWIDPATSRDRKRGSPAGYFRTFALEAQAISELFPDKRPLDVDVLDFGMGWGLWCLMAKAHGFNARGFEVSAERLAFARSNGLEAIEDFGALLRMRFDFVNAEQVFEHIDDPLGTLKSLAGTLKPGGVIRIAVPDGSGIEAKLRRPGWKAAKDALHPLEHINCFTFRSLGRLGEAAGLRIIRPPIVVHDLKSLVKSALGSLGPGPKGTTVFFTPR